jgi:hypothetical protein
MEEAYINGQESNLIYMKVNLSKAKEMVEVHFGGQMEVGMKVNLGMVYKVVMVYYTEMEELLNIKVLGIMVCLMAKEHNTSKMDKNMKVHSNKINFMEMVYFIKMIQLYMVYGKITNYLS